MLMVEPEKRQCILVRGTLCCWACCCSASPRTAAFAASVITAKLDDPKAVYLTAPEFAVHADGKDDDSAALQAAIDQAGNTAREGIVFVPSRPVSPGADRLRVGPGVRVFGYGATRPVFLLAANTPGFQSGIGVMVMFTGSRPGKRPPMFAKVPFPPSGSVPPNAEAADANPGTFYSAMSNVDFEIGDGNPAAVAIRFHVAQHGILSHMDFHIGSGLAALHQVGNEAEDLRFYGGRYAILAGKDFAGRGSSRCSTRCFRGSARRPFANTRRLSRLVRDTFRDVPTAIDIDPEYYDQLWVKDCRFENVSRAAVVIGSEKSHLNEIGFENAVLKNVPVFARFHDSGKQAAAKGPVYRVANFNYGLIVPALGQMGHARHALRRGADGGPARAASARDSRSAAVG